MFEAFWVSDSAPCQLCSPEKGGCMVFGRHAETDPLKTTNRLSKQRK